MIDFVRDVIESMISEATLGANGVMFMSAFIVATMIIFRPNRKSLSQWGQMFAVGLFTICCAFMLRIGKWAVSQIFRLAEDEQYHPLIFEVRDLLTPESAFFVSYGTMLCFGGYFRIGGYWSCLFAAALWMVFCWAMFSYPVWLRWN